MKILFQGDSITDAKRTDIGLEGFFGAGYVLLIKSHLEFSEPAVTVINRGVGGNRITDLYARWKSDCLNLAPDVLTIDNTCIKSLVSWEATFNEFKSFLTFNKVKTNTIKWLVN